MKIETCGICGATWEPELATHRVGTDCVSSLSAELRSLSMLVARMEEAFTKRLNEHVDAEVEGFRRLGATIQESVHQTAEPLQKRITALEAMLSRKRQ